MSRHPTTQHPRSVTVTASTAEISIPKTGLTWYDGLRAYGAAILLWACARGLDAPAVPEIQDLPDRYLVRADGLSLTAVRQRQDRVRRAFAELLVSLHGLSPDPSSMRNVSKPAKAASPEDILRHLRRHASIAADRLLPALLGTPPDGRARLQAFIEPAAVDHPRGTTALQPAPSDGMTRPLHERPELAFLAACLTPACPPADPKRSKGADWITAGEPADGVHQSPTFAGVRFYNVATTGQGSRQQRLTFMLILPLGSSMTIANPIAMTALISGRKKLWSQSTAGTMCHAACILARQGVFPADGGLLLIAATHTIRPHLRGRSAFLSMLPADALSLDLRPFRLLASSREGVRFLTHLDLDVYSGDAQAAALRATRFLTNPSLETLADYLRTLATDLPHLSPAGFGKRSAGNPGKRRGTAPTTETATEVIRVVDELEGTSLADLFGNPSVQSVARMFRGIVARQVWSHVDPLYSVRTQEDLLGTIAGALRFSRPKTTPASRDKSRKAGKAQLFVPNDEDLEQVLRLASNGDDAARQVALAIACLATSRWVKKPSGSEAKAPERPESENRNEGGQA
jgi:hypothetical protein